MPLHATAGMHVDSGAEAEQKQVWRKQDTIPREQDS
jgi:hypothetical protein